LQRSVELSPEDVDARFHYGLNLAQENQLDLAIEQFDACIQLDANHADAYYNLGVAYAFKEETSKALGFLNEALRIDPEHSMAASVKQFIEDSLGGEM
jgi:tetratricopeptide (TPR) repeat protein